MQLVGNASQHMHAHIRASTGGIAARALKLIGLPIPLCRVFHTRPSTRLIPCTSSDAHGWCIVRHTPLSTTVAGPPTLLPPPLPTPDCRWLRAYASAMRNSRTLLRMGAAQPCSSPNGANSARHFRARQGKYLNATCATATPVRCGKLLLSTSARAHTHTAQPHPSHIHGTPCEQQRTDTPVWQPSHRQTPPPQRGAGVLPLPGTTP